MQTSDIDLLGELRPPALSVIAGAQRALLEQEAQAFADRLLVEDDLAHEFYPRYLRTLDACNEILAMGPEEAQTSGPEEALAQDPYMDSPALMGEDELNSRLAKGRPLPASCIPVGEEGPGLYLCWEWKDGEDPYSRVHAALALQALRGQFRARREVPRGTAVPFAQALQHLPTPVALFGGSGDLLAHNRGFGQLGISPQKCLAMKDGDRVSCEQGEFALWRRELVQDGRPCSYLAFLQVGRAAEAQASLSPQELGIITSSMAHELNNPVAGILAGLEVLEMDLENCPEQLAIVREMRATASRCRRPINIFLGLSKAHIDEGRAHSMEGAVGEALDLLRSRMMESDTMIQVTWPATVALEEVAGNDVVWPMAFYMIFNEALTAYAHRELVQEERQARSRVHAWEVTVEGKDLILRSRDFPPLEKALRASKLFNYLSGLLGRTPVFSPGALTLKL